MSGTFIIYLRKKEIRSNCRMPSEGFLLDTERWMMMHSGSHKELVSRMTHVFSWRACIIEVINNSIITAQKEHGETR